MKDSDAHRLIRKLDDITSQLTRMNDNHVEIGRLFKAWTETVEPEELTVEFEDRERFVPGMRVEVIDPSLTMYKYTGIIERITPSYMLVRFEGVSGVANLYPGQVKPALRLDKKEN